MRGNFFTLIVACSLIALSPTSLADERVAQGCMLVEHAQYVYGGLTPVSQTAGPVCWLADDALEPLAPFTDDVPSAVQNGAYACQDVSTVWNELAGMCMWATAIGSAQISYSQQEIACWPTTMGGVSCSYAPTFHATAESMMPGEWILRANSQIRNWGPVKSVVAGSQRSLECTFETPVADTESCSAQIANLVIVAGNTNSYRWEGAWTLTYVDATGAHHLQAYGAAEGWLAQYY